MTCNFDMDALRRTPEGRQGNEILSSNCCGMEDWMPNECQVNQKSIGREEKEEDKTTEKIGEAPPKRSKHATRGGKGGGGGQKRSAD